MGFHICPFCQAETSSGDVLLTFSSGRCWQVPDTILHYVRDHNYKPPEAFVADVFGSELSNTGGITLNIEPVLVGYLRGLRYTDDIWSDPEVREEFAGRLERHIQSVKQAGMRRRVRGVGNQ